MSKFFFFGFRPSLSLAAIFLFYVLVVTTNAEPFQLCVDHECKEIISYGKTTQNYNPPKTGMLRFKSDEDAKILVKNVGGNPAYLRVQINNDIGIVPKNMVKEEQVYVSSEVLVSVPVQTIGKEGQFSVSSSGIPIDIDGKDGGAGMLMKDIGESIKESSALGLEEIEYTAMKNLTPDDINRPPNDTAAQSNTTHDVPNSGASVAVDGFKIPESAVETKDGIKDEYLVKPETESKLSESEPFDTMDKDGEIGIAGHGSHPVQRTPEAEPHFAKAKENSEASEVSGHESDQVLQNSEAEPHFVKAKDEVSGHGSDHVPKTPETQPHFEKENNNLNSEASQITGHADSNDIPQNSNVRGSDQYLSEAVLESTRFVNDQVKGKLNEQGGVNNEVKQGINNLDTPEAAIGNIAPENGTVATRETDNEDESNGNGEENGSEYLSNDDKLLPEDKKQSEPTQKPDVQTADHVTPTAPKSEVYEGTTLYPQSSGESANPGYHVENTGSRKPYDSRKYRPTPIPYPNMLHRNSGSFGGKTEKERPGTQESLEENKEQKGYIQPDSDGADHLLEKTHGTEVTPAPESFSTAENTSPGSVDSSNENKATMDESITTPGPMWDSTNKDPSGMNKNEEFSVPKDKSILSDIKPSLEDNTHNNQPKEELESDMTSSIPEEQSVEVTSSPEVPDLDNSLVYPDEKESDSDDKLDTVEEDKSNSPEVEDEASMKLGEDAVCRLKDYFLFITGVMLPEGIMIAIEEEVSSPYMSRGKFILLVVIASTIVILYLCHLFMVKISREGPILEAMNCIDRKLRVIQEENNNLKQSSLGLTSKSFGVTPEYIELQKAKERTDRIEKALKDKVDELGKKNEQLETDLESSQANEDELNKMLNEILASQKKTTNFEDAVNQLQSMLDSQQKEVDGLKSDLAVKTRLNEELKTELKANKKRSSKLEYQIEQLSRSLEEMTASKLELSKRVSEDEKTMNSLKDENSSLKEDMKEAKQETARLGKESARFSEEIRSLKKKLSAKEAECQVSKECLKKLQIYSDTNGKDAHSKLMETFKVIEMKSSLESFEHSFENQSEELSSQTVALQEAKGQITDLESTVRQAEDRAERASKVRDDALARLQVLGDHFKERETQLERELETRDSLLRDAEGTAVSGTTRLQTYDVELKSCRNQIENLRKELDSQEQSYKKQLANEENKLLDSWMNTRSAERRQEELRQENAQLRQLLTQAHKSTEGGGGPVVKPTPKRAESNGSVSSPVTVEGTPFGPLPPPPLMPPPFHGGPPHIPPPGFLPPPMFGHLPPPPPMMPDRRRLPPAGRMASPPGVDRRSYSPSSNHSSYSDRRYSPDLSHSPERGRRYRGPHSPQEPHHHYRRGPSPEHWYHQSPPHYPHSPPGSLDSFDSRGGDGRPNRSKKTSTPANYGER